MKALLLGEAGDLTYTEVQAPHRENECLLNVRLAGICGTDLQLLDGYAGFRGIPGHEFVGQVLEAPQAAARWVGRRVVGEINVGCGTCRWCSDGVREHCVARTVVGIRGRDGAFAELLALPAENLHEVPDAVDDATAVFVEPVAAACRMLEQVDVRRETRVAILGDGRMGLLAAQVLRTRTSRLIVIGAHDAKLAVARGLGIETATAAGHDENGAFDVVVDATGRPTGLPRALELVRPRGTIVLKSTFHGAVPLPSWPIVVDEVTLIGSRCGPFRKALDLLAAREVQVAPLVSRIARLDEHESAFADARRMLKVLLSPAA